MHIFAFLADIVNVIVGVIILAAWARPIVNTHLERFHAWRNEKSQMRAEIEELTATVEKQRAELLVMNLGNEIIKRLSD